MARTTGAVADDATLSTPLRLYIYALHGFFTEVLFTAAWDFVVKPDPKLHGNWNTFLSQLSRFIRCSSTRVMHVRHTTLCIQHMNVTSTRKYWLWLSIIFEIRTPLYFNLYKFFLFFKFVFAIT